MSMVEKSDRFISFGQYQNALPVIRKAYTDMKQANNTDNVFFAQIAQTLGELYIYICKYKEAETPLSEAFNIWKKSSKDEKQNYYRTISALAAAYAGQNNPDKAENLYNKAEKIAINESGRCSLAFGILEYETGCFYYDNGNFSAALPRLKLSAETFKGKNLRRDWRYRDALWKMAEIYQTKNDNHNAELCLLLVASAALNEFGKSSNEYAKALLYVSKFYKDISKSTKEKKFREDAKQAVLATQTEKKRIAREKKYRCSPIQ